MGGRITDEEAVETRGIHDLRKMLHMQAIVPSTCRCLRCGKDFRSKNKNLFRVCNSCKEKNDHEEIRI